MHVDIIYKTRAKRICIYWFWLTLANSKNKNKTENDSFDWHIRLKWLTFLFCQNPWPTKQAPLFCPEKYPFTKPKQVPFREACHRDWFDWMKKIQNPYVTIKTSSMSHTTFFVIHHQKLFIFHMYNIFDWIRNSVLWLFYVIINFLFCWYSKAVLCLLNKNRKQFSVLFSFLSLARVGLIVHFLAIRLMLAIHIYKYKTDFCICICTTFQHHL